MLVEITQIYIKYLRVLCQKLSSFLFKKHLQSHWAFATNSDFLIPISVQPDVIDLRYFKLWLLLYQTIKILNIKGLHNLVVQVLENWDLLQRLNSFESFYSLLSGVATTSSIKDNDNCSGIYLFHIVETTTLS